jgi:hypothetical protein
LGVADSAFFAFAQRALCAAAILARPAALMGLRFVLGARAEPFGLPGPRVAVVSESSSLACSRREISASISERMTVMLTGKLLIEWVSLYLCQTTSLYRMSIYDLETANSTYGQAAVELDKLTNIRTMHEPEMISSAQWRQIMRQPTIRQIWGTNDEDETEQFASRVYVAKFDCVSEDCSWFLYLVQPDTIHASPVTLLQHRGSLYAISRVKSKA